MRHLFLIDGQEQPGWLARDGGVYWLDLDGVRIRCALTPDGRRWRLRCGEAEETVFLAVDGDHVFIHLDGETHEILYRDAVLHHAEAAGGHAVDDVRAPMPGTVVATPVKEGDVIKAGTVLMVIESMKLETALKAGRDGVVGQVHVAVGRTFERDALLVSLVAEG